MTKQEAYQEMLAGHKMCHTHYTDDEFVFINENGEFETEDGYTHGGVNDEFWSIYQKWDDGWSYYDAGNTDVDITRIAKHISNDPYVYVLRSGIEELDYIRRSEAPTTAQIKDAERTKPVQSKSVINRNDVCSCGSGKKFKKCCLNKSI